MNESSSTTTTFQITSHSSSSSSSSDFIDSSDYSSTTITSSFNSKTQQKKNSKYKILFILIITISFFVVFIFLVNIVIYSNIKKRVKEHKEEVLYEMKYYDMINDEIIEGMIIKDNSMIRRGWEINDENGVGYVFLSSVEESEEEVYNDDEEESVFEVNGECQCCAECKEDKDCEHFCVDEKCVECKVDTDCVNNNNENEMTMSCNMYGKCINKILSCERNSDCENNEICQVWNGVCVKGCKTDESCRKGEICFGNNECINGVRCNDNFDCNDYDDVCIDNVCNQIDNTISCSYDNECDNGYHCNYEYYICVKDKDRSSKMIGKRRSTDAIPIAMCYLYGTITLFMIATSHTIATNKAKDKLFDECYQKCTETFLHTFDSDEGGINVNKIDAKLAKKVSKKQKKIKRDSTCTGKCVKRTNLEHRWEIVQAENLCPTLSLTQVITVNDQREFIGRFPNRKYVGSEDILVFKYELIKYCQINSYFEWGGEVIDPVCDTRRELHEERLCIMDEYSIKCKRNK